MIHRAVPPLFILLGSLTAFADSSGEQGSTQSASVPAPEAPLPASVVVRGDTVLVLRERLGGFSARDRAAAIASRLREFAVGPAQDVRVDAQPAWNELVVGDRVLMTVTDADAAHESVSRDSLSRRWATMLTRGLRAERPNAILRDVLVGVAWTVGALVLLLVMLRGIGGASGRLLQWLEASRDSGPMALRVQRFELLSSSAVVDILQGAVRSVRAVVMLALGGAFVPLSLSFFPWTRDLSQSFWQSVLSPLRVLATAVVGYLPNVVVIVIVALFTRFVLAAVHGFFRAIESGAVSFRQFEREWAEPTYTIVRFLVLVFAVVIIFPYLPGAKSDAFKGMSIFLGVLLSFGSGSAISNIVAGVVLTYTRAFRVGDRVQIGDATGDVFSKTLLVTRIRTVKNVNVTIPNSVVLNSHVLNYSAEARSRGLILHARVTIGYDAPWRHVHQLLTTAAQATPGVRHDPAPFVLQTALDDFYVHYELNATVDDAHGMAATYSQLHANIQDAFNAAGVEIMSPHYRAERDGSASTIPGPRATQVP